jgi:hypothetical protein
MAYLVIDPSLAYVGINLFGGKSIANKQIYNRDQNEDERIESSYQHHTQ